MATFINVSKGNQIVEQIVKGASITAGSRYIALYSNVFAGTEVTGGDYARVNASTVMGTASSGLISNTSDITFASSSAATNIDGVGVWTASSGGTEIARWTLTTSRSVGSGDILKMPTGSLIFGEVGI